MSASERNKGANGEREFAKLLSEATGYTFERAGTKGKSAADVVPVPMRQKDEWLRGFEVKRRKQVLWMMRAMEQAEEIEGGGHIALRFDGGEWWMMIPFEQYAYETDLWKV